MIDIGLTAAEQYSARYSDCEGIPSGMPVTSKPLSTLSCPKSIM